MWQLCSEWIRIPSVQEPSPCPQCVWHASASHPRNFLQARVGDTRLVRCFLDWSLTAT